MAIHVPAPWVNSNWITFPTGSPARLTALRLFIQEVSDRISQDTREVLKGRTVDPALAEYQTLLGTLQAKEEIEAERTDLSTGARVGWTQGFAAGPGMYPPGVS